MKHIAILYFLLIIPTLSYEQNWKYLSQKPPVSKAELFAPNLVSTQHNERDFAISPDGKRIYYSIVGNRNLSVIVERKYEKNKWQSPQIASFSGNYYDIEPTFSSDGNELYFSSNRNGNFDIWFVRKTKDGNWSSPTALNKTINTNENEYFPSITKNGTLYWTANYPSGNGGEDIWFSKKINGEYQKPEVLPKSVCGLTNEFNAFIDPNENYIIFGSEKRPYEVGGGDLYISYNKNGIWSEAKNLIEANSTSLDYSPFVSADGKYLYFSSNRKSPTNHTKKPWKLVEFLNFLNGPGNGNGDIYWIKTDAVISK